MLPPRTVYSLVIRNHSNKKATVLVSYTDAAGAVTTSTIKVAANGSATAPEKTYTSGSAVFAMEISKVAIQAATADATAASISAPFPSVYSPVKDYPIEIVSKNGSLSLVAKYSE